jgi:7,8-dihydropterin-6-yl-methyl-4-(beta-D-ribofuranosyl)aminobenzene 5'-phosphate synthase
LETVCPTHCTQFRARIKAIYPEKYIEGGAGVVLDI